MKVYGLLEEAGLESFASAPTPAFRGRVYFDTTQGQAYVYDGSLWQSIGSSGGSVTVTGSLGSPSLITAAGGVTPAGATHEIIFIAGSGGAIDVTKDPQIAVGTVVGQLLEPYGTSGVNTVLLEDATGLLLNGPWLAEAGSFLSLFWNGAVWAERSRR